MNEKSKVSIRGTIGLVANEQANGTTGRWEDEFRGRNLRSNKLLEFDPAYRTDQHEELTSLHDTYNQTELVDSKSPIKRR